MGQPVYVVGGFVRDFYLNRVSDERETDIDFITVGEGVTLAELVAESLQGSSLTVYRNFGTAHIRWNTFSLEFVGARKESYQRKSRKPLVENGTLEEDQNRRDFTMNALYWDISPQHFGVLIDPFGGIQDLQNGIIRTPVNPNQTFSDDPLRMFRAIRFAAQLGFQIDEDTLVAIGTNRSRTKILSAERIIAEVNKIVSAPIPSVGFSLLFKTGLLQEFFPELANLQGVEEKFGIRHKDNFWHTLEVLDNVAKVSENLWLRWAAIMHDIAKPPTKRFEPGVGWTFHGHDAIGAKWVKKIFKRLSLPLDQRMEYVAKLVQLHLRPIALVNDTVTDSAIRRLLFEAGNDVEDLMILCRADITSKNDRKVKKYLGNFDKVEQRMREVEEKDRIRNWQPPLDGNDIMHIFELNPGKSVGILKEAVKEAIIEGEIANSREEALQFLKLHAHELLDNYHG